MRKLLSTTALLSLAAACGPDDLYRVEPGIDVGPTTGWKLDAGSAIPPLPDAAMNPIDSGASDTGSIDHGPKDLGVVDTGPAPDAGEPDLGPPDAGDQRECYTEPFDHTVPIDDLRSQFNGANAFSLLRTALGRRYPAGHDLLVVEQNDPYTGTFTDRSSFRLAMESGMTEVHEATHGWDYSHSLFYQHFDLWIRGDLQHSMDFSIAGFPRSEIYNMVENDSTSIYQNLYLVGTQGRDGFIELLDETNCYINGLGAIAALQESTMWGISGRDGAVAFLYYIELYLKRARTNYPMLYQTMMNNAALKEHLKIQWLRTNFFLMFADMRPEIGIEDGRIRQLLYRPDNMQEMSAVIGRCIDQTNCLCD